MTAKADTKPFVDKGWNSVNWNPVHSNVQRLQARIVKAWKDKKYKTVKHLQKLLRRSLSARLLAVKRVTANKGKKTPGIDGVVWKTSEDKWKAVEQLKSEKYTPQPMRRIYIPKKNGKKRPLSIPTMPCRGKQQLHLLALDPIAETEGDKYSYGYRKSRSTADAIQRTVCILAKKSSAQWILECDIAGCFDNISHEWLLNHIPTDKKTLKKWLKAGYMDKKVLYQSIKGSFQGSPISPVLANMTLDGLEKVLEDKFGKGGTYRGLKYKVHLNRYSDDFYVTGKSKTILEKEALPTIKEFLSQRGLSLSEEKTQIVHIKEGFDFLGKNIRKWNGKPIIVPSKSSSKEIKAKVKDVVMRYKGACGMEMIKKLNPILKGWVYYHRHTSSSRKFSDLEHYVYTKLWRWCTRRHPNKSKKWIMKKYFEPTRARKWTFHCKGERIFLPTTVKIIRHRLIKGEANPYDDEWRGYFDERETAKLAHKHPKRLKRILDKQEKRCTKCGGIIQTLWDGILHTPGESMTLTGEILISKAKLIHRKCHHAGAFTGP